MASKWADSSHGLRWDSIFVLPDWMRIWWQAFGTESEPYLSSVWQGDKIVGIAPLLVRGETASLIGSTDVCDYLDFVITPGMERDFFSALLDDLPHRGITHLDLGPLRPDSTVMTVLVNMAQNRGHGVLCNWEDVSLELDLPATWDEYLAGLDKKQRHEVRRKLRRLYKAGNVNYRVVEEAAVAGEAMDTFLELFSKSRGDKEAFMTPPMESFFRLLADTMTAAGLLKFSILELDGLPMAIVMYFNFGDDVYLYNSSYDPEYKSLSVGLLSKICCIKDSIERGSRKFDFLKGGESYKYRLGAKEVPLYRCQITLK